MRSACRAEWRGEEGLWPTCLIKHVLSYDGAERSSEQQEQQRRQAGGQVPGRWSWRTHRCVCTGRRGGLSIFRGAPSPDLGRFFGLHAERGGNQRFADLIAFCLLRHAKLGISAGAWIRWDRYEIRGEASCRVLS